MTSKTLVRLAAVALACAMPFIGYAGNTTRCLPTSKVIDESFLTGKLTDQVK